MVTISRDILVFNSGTSDQRIVQDVLNRGPYHTITTSNTLEALKFLHKREFNLIIACLGDALDWNMVSTIHAASKKAPILAIIPENSQIDPRQILQAGVWKVITTPVREEELSNVLQKLDPCINP